MSRRRDKMRNAYSNTIGQGVKKDAQDIDPNTQKICGTCTKFSENAFTSDGRGTCSILKMGSNISLSPPEYILEGKGGYNTRTLSLSENCEYYEKMAYIDKNGYECSDPQYKRTIRQLK